MPRHPFEAEEASPADSFSLDDLKRAATDAAAEIEPETLSVPLRGRGWFVPFQEAALEAAEQRERENLEQGLPDGPFEEYCYMCASWTAQNNNPMRTAIQGFIDSVKDFSMSRAVMLIAKYYRKWVQPRVGKHWSVNSIRDHITQHRVDPQIILTENIRGIQCFIDAHTAAAEEITPAAEDEEGSQPARKKRRVNLKQEEGFLKMVRMQASLITMLQRLRNEAASGGSSSGGGGGGGKSM